jgi:hypothetical protein
MWSLPGTLDHNLARDGIHAARLGGNAEVLAILRISN